MRSLHHGLLATCCTLAMSSAGAATDLTLVGGKHCLDLITMSGARATASLPPGRYDARLVDNTLLCAGGGSGRRCAVDRVIVRIYDQAERQAGTLMWAGDVDGRGRTVKVPGGGEAEVSAFVVDAPCTDNVGQATLRFTPLE